MSGSGQDVWKQMIYGTTRNLAILNPPAGPASHILPLCASLIAPSGSGSGIPECLLFLFCAATSVVALSP